MEFSEDPDYKGPQPAKPRNWFSRFLNIVEWLGNLLPHPVTLFALFALGIILVSGLAGWFEWGVMDPRPEGAKGRAPEGMIRAVSLLNGAGLRMIVENLVTNFTGFVPLGTVLVALLGVGVAEYSGLINAAIRGGILKAPKNLVTVAIVFGGVISNTASEMGYVVIVPLAGAIFLALGRHPIAGMAAAFAGVSGGYSANILIGTVDPLLAGITQEAARIIDPDYFVHPAVNWYFMFASTFLITALTTIITLKIVEPRLGKFNLANADEGIEDETRLHPLNKQEKKGLLGALISILILTGLILLTVVPEWGVLRNPETGEILNSPFLRGMVALIFVFFVVPGFVYGKITGSLKNDKDVIKGMEKSMRTLGLYIVLVFFAAQFVAYFSWSNIGPIVAVKGADFLTAIGLTNPLVFIPFILMCCFVNLMLGSASAQWAITAPIFVPMLMLIGYSPEVIQAAYRIGDSSTNIITPMMSYFGLILAFANKYDRNIGIGTIISIMLPYSLIFILGWTLFFYLWVFILNLPVGPAAPTYYIPGF
ncbi:MAG: AbgT family transporter [Bacteroidia bacterium]